MQVHERLSGLKSMGVVDMGARVHLMRLFIIMIMIISIFVSLHSSDFLMMRNQILQSA